MINNITNGLKGIYWMATGAIGLVVAVFLASQTSPNTLFEHIGVLCILGWGFATLIMGIYQGSVIIFRKGNEHGNRTT